MTWFGKALASFQQWDLAALRLINVEWTSPALDTLMATVSSFALFKIPLALGAIALLVWGGFRGRLFLVMMALCLVLGDGGVNWGLKLTVNRPRPHETHEAVRIVDLNEVKWSQPARPQYGRSFTSGHACNNIALALVATVVYRSGWALLLWPWAALVGYSRIYTGAHYPSDILGSWVIALGYTWAILRLSGWLWERYAPRLAPELSRRHPKLFNARS